MRKPNIVSNNIRITFNLLNTVIEVNNRIIFFIELVYSVSDGIQILKHKIVSDLIKLFRLRIWKTYEGIVVL